MSFQKTVVKALYTWATPVFPLHSINGFMFLDVTYRQLYGQFVRITAGELQQVHYAPMLQ